MNTLKNISEQLQLAWRQASVPSRVIFIGSALLCLALIIGVGVWSSRPQYVPLENSLDPARAANIVSALDAQGIENKLDFSGSTVLVPHADFAKARSAAGEHLTVGVGGYDADAPSFMDDPTKSRDRLLRRLEQQLARSITTLHTVDKATVHIAKAESTPFLREQSPTTASVVIDVREGVLFPREEAMAIVAIVTGGVEGLAQENVTVADTKGRIHFSAGMELHTGIGSQLEYQSKTESLRVAKAEHMLAKMLGQGKALVRVTADIDFTTRERDEITYDSDNQAIVHEITESESTTTSASTAQGVTGSGANLGGRSATGSGSPGGKERETSTIISEPSRSTEITKEAAGQLTRLTIAAIVDLTPNAPEEQSDDAVAATVPDTTITKEQIEGIIKTAVGFDTTRGDEIEVVVAELPDIVVDVDEQLATEEQWAFYAQLAKHGSLGLASIVALVLGMLIVRKLRPVSSSSSKDDWLMAGRARAMAELSQQANQDPDTVSQILSSWLNDPSEVAASGNRTSQSQTSPKSSNRRAA
jgi:flagellar M-ring protein FliF